eukprot:s1361_g1.t1
MDLVGPMGHFHPLQQVTTIRFQVTIQLGPFRPPPRHLRHVLVGTILRPRSKDHQVEAPDSASQTVDPDAEVLLVNQDLTSAEWVEQVQFCLNDPTRTRAASEFPPHKGLVLAQSTKQAIKEDFVAAVNALDRHVPSREGSDSGQCPWRGQTLGSDQAEFYVYSALVRPSDWVPNDDLTRSDMPTYGLFSIGQQITARDTEIPRWCLPSLIDRASKRGKGQQEAIIGLIYKGVSNTPDGHLALKAGCNDMVQLKCASNGIVTTAEKYVVARSEHRTIKCIIVSWDDMSFIRDNLNKSDPQNTSRSNGDSKDARDRGPDPDRGYGKSYERHDYDEEDP